MTRKPGYFFLLVVVLLLFSGSCQYAPFVNYFLPHRAGKFPHASHHARLMGSINPMRSCYDVNFYDMHIALDPDKKTVTGSVAISFTAQQDFNTLLLDMGPKLRVRSIRCENSAIRFRHRRNALYVTFKTQQKQNSRNTITITYDGHPANVKGEGVVIWKKDAEGKPWMTSICQGVGAFLIWPCKDLLYDEADSMAMHLTVPKGLMGLSNGKLVDRKDNGTTETFHWFCANTINDYGICVTVGNYKAVPVSYTNASGVHTLTGYALAEHYDAAVKHFAQFASIFSFYESIYGEYPWYNDGYKLIETPNRNDGMEHQTAIAWGGPYRNNGLGFDDLIAHETAHEWWGNSMTARDYNDIWLHESFATYSEYLYHEHINGHARFVRTMNFLMRRIESEVKQNSVPIIKPANVRYCAWASPRDLNIYDKGAMVLHSLRTLIGDSAFFRVLKTFYAAHQKSNITTADFMQQVQTVTGKNYDWFFQQYLYDYHIPELEYSIAAETDTRSIFEYRWSGAVNGFAMPVSLVIGKDTLELHPGKEPARLLISTPDTVRFDRSRAYYVTRQINPR